MQRMKQRKRSVQVCLICLLVILVCKINAVAAGTNISFSDPTAKKGESVTVTLKVTSGGTALGAVDLSIVYDDSALEFTGGGSAVKGGSGSIRIADTASDSKTKTLTYELTFTAKKAGKSSIKVSNYEVVGFDESVLSVDHVGSSTVEVTDESVSLSKDASLKDLKLSNGTLTPAFSPSIMNYTAAVGADVTSVVVSGTTTNEKAAITSISGADNLKEGSNPIKVSVTAESGATAVYTINVTKEGAVQQVEATPTPAPTDGATPTAEPSGEPSVTPEVTVEAVVPDFTIQINDKTLTPVNLPEGAALKGYTVGELEYQGHKLQALVSEYMELYVINMQDETGAQDFYVYYKEIDQFTEFIKIDNGDGKFIVVLDGYPRDISIYGFERTTILINDKKVGIAWKYTDELISYSNAAAEYYLVGGLSDSGVSTWYVFDYVEKTYQRYFVQPANLIEEKSGPDLTLTEQEQQVKELQAAYQKMKSKRVMTFLVLGGIILILLLAVVNLFLKTRMLQADLKEYEEEPQEHEDNNQREQKNKRQRVVEPRQPRGTEPRQSREKESEAQKVQQPKQETKLERPESVKQKPGKKAAVPRSIQQLEEEEFFDEADMIPKEMESELIKDKISEENTAEEFSETRGARNSSPQAKSGQEKITKKDENVGKTEKVPVPKSKETNNAKEVKKSERAAVERSIKSQQPSADNTNTARSERPATGNSQKSERVSAGNAQKSEGLAAERMVRSERPTAERSANSEGPAAKREKPLAQRTARSERPTAASRVTKSERQIRGERANVTERSPRSERAAKSEKASKPAKSVKQPVKPVVKKKPAKVIEKEFKEEDFDFEFIDLDEE